MANYNRQEKRRMMMINLGSLFPIISTQTCEYPVHANGHRHIDTPDPLLKPPSGYILSTAKDKPIHPAVKSLGSAPSKTSKTAWIKISFLIPLALCSGVFRYGLPCMANISFLCLQTRMMKSVHRCVYVDEQSTKPSTPTKHRLCH